MSHKSCLNGFFSTLRSEISQFPFSTVSKKLQQFGVQVVEVLFICLYLLDRTSLKVKQLRVVTKQDQDNQSKHGDTVMHGRKLRQEVTHRKDLTSRPRFLIWLIM